ncbi:aminotransferase [Rhodoblastus acidophilus]|uniref:aspartate transaminase n=1 Tax=Rhodoblastus acidophilus TaxID=1074 RepID=A0A6N8DRN4_RHOAC|nr:aminotransferase [Rhodoblastus acidophilus]MCW2274802.1 aspartate/methionine/tyrosine aminotransferase [Rhodoblastus acidophilus]MTV33119.1 aminotransferase [Rhodoblastus acidophilus]
MANATFSQVQTSIFEIMSTLAREKGAENLGQGFPEGLEPPELIEAAIKALRDGPHQYPPMMGLPALRQAVADNACRFFGLDAEAENVMITSGATEALSDCFLALLNPGDEVIVFEPVYDSYAPIIRRGGAVPVAVKLTPPDWRLPFEQVSKAITPRTRALVVNTPMNPIGKVFDDSELRFLADLMLKHDLLAICDEVYEHLVFEGEHKSLFSFPDVRDRVARIGSAGKSFSVTGWKVGYVMADAKLLGPIARAHQFVTFTTAPALQAAVAAGLNMSQTYFDGLKQALRTRRDFLTEGLNQLGFTVRPAQATYFAVADVTAFDENGDDLAFCRRMVEEAGVAAIPLSAFYENRDLSGHIRFCFAKQQDTLARALQKLSRWRNAQ